MRAAAQVAPGEAAVTAHVVVDRELGSTDLDRRALGRSLGAAALETDELALVRLVLELGERLVVGDLAAHEGLPLVDDALHDLLELLEVVGVERLLDVEVVVEAVLDGRTDAEPGLGVDLLHGLGEHVRCRVAQDVQAVLLVDPHGLDSVSVGEDVREVAQLAVDPRHHDGPVLGEEVSSRRLLGHRSLAPGDVDGDLRRHVCTPRWASSVCRERTARERHTDAICRPQGAARQFCVLSGPGRLPPEGVQWPCHGAAAGETLSTGRTGGRRVGLRHARMGLVRRAGHDRCAADDRGGRGRPGSGPGSARAAALAAGPAWLRGGQASSTSASPAARSTRRTT